MREYFVIGDPPNVYVYIITTKSGKRILPILFSLVLDYSSRSELGGVILY